MHFWFSFAEIHAEILASIPSNCTWHNHTLWSMPFPKWHRLHCLVRIHERLSQEWCQVTVKGRHLCPIFSGCPSCCTTHWGSITSFTANCQRQQIKVSRTENVNAQRGSADAKWDIFYGILMTFPSLHFLRTGSPLQWSTPVRISFLGIFQNVQHHINYRSPEFPSLLSSCCLL